MLGPDQMHHMTRISDALRAGQDGTSGVHRGGALLQLDHQTGMRYFCNTRYFLQPEPELATSRNILLDPAEMPKIPNSILDESEKKVFLV